MKNVPTIGFILSLLFLTSCAAPPPRPRPYVHRQPLYRPSATTASPYLSRYTIDVIVELDSTITLDQNRVMVELRKGTPGASSVFAAQYFEGQTGTVSFSNMPDGSYFIDIGNGDTVAVGPVHPFSGGQNIHSTVRVSFTSGNIATRSRSSL